MKKLTLAVIVFAGMGTMAFAQKDTTVKKPVIKDTIKSKMTGMVYGTEENLLAFDIKTDSVKKAAPKPDTLKTGAIDMKSTMFYAWVGPQTDSSKTKVKSDTIKTGTKMNATGYLPTSAVFAFFDGPQADSTKKATAKPDSTIGKPSPQKRTSSLYFDKKTGSIIALPKEINYSEAEVA